MIFLNYSWGLRTKTYRQMTYETEDLQGKKPTGIKDIQDKRPTRSKDIQDKRYLG